MGRPLGTRKPLNCIGKKYGKLYVIKEVRLLEKRRYVLCKCDCGNYKEIKYDSIIGGATKSCGCAMNIGLKRAREVCTKHGMTNTRQRIIWRNMRNRCNNIGGQDYKNYGGRGIMYNVKREEFKGFWEDMGLTYEDGLTLDRIDNNGSYCKENCRRITRKQQNNNRRDNRIIEHNGIKKTLSEWSDYYNIKYRILWQRMNRGKTFYEAISM